MPSPPPLALLRAAARLLVGLGALLVCACGAAGPAPTPYLPARIRGEAARSEVPVAIDRGLLERRIHEEINRVRAGQGLSTLERNEALYPVALAHSRDMAARGYFGHFTPEGRGPLERYTAGGVECRIPRPDGRIAATGENLHFGHLVATYRPMPDGGEQPTSYFTLEALVSEVLHGWLNSPPHREMMLQPQWRTEAVAVFIAPSGRFYVTENFC